MDALDDDRLDLILAQASKNAGDMSDFLDMSQAVPRRSSLSNCHHGDFSHVANEMSSVRSSAIVTYSSKSKFPAFLQLSPHTNLNLAPSNWLRSSPGLRPGVSFCAGPLHETVAGGASPNEFRFSSFHIADTHLNDLGEIDMISDAENVKKLLKVPFSKSHVSMAIHRIGKTLLLEELDTHSLWFNSRKWQWFRDISNNLLKHDKKDGRVLHKKKLPSAQVYRRMLSKFLYYSIKQASGGDDKQDEVVDEGNSPSEVVEKCDEECTVKTCADETEVKNVRRNRAAVQHRIRHRHDTTSSTTSSSTSEVVAFERRWKYWTPDGAGIPSANDISETFERTILWTFEDLQMLLGTNLPIFGSGEYPAVTLRLRDSNEPINILTGLDYWLDNLICNVPEVVMCFHVNGIVQNYEVIKTEEIPRLKDSRFNPGVVKDIAQNILSFLKSNCTKEGHTYWLFKGSNDDVVKLYDLTTLSSQRSINSGNNPFTIPVASLLYKMAINLFQHKNREARAKQTIGKLLRNCVMLLEGEACLAPVMLTGALCMLSSLSLPDPPGPCCTKSSTANFAAEDGSPDGGKRKRTNSIIAGEAPAVKQTTAAAAVVTEAERAEVAIIDSVTDLSIPRKYAHSTAASTTTSSSDHRDVTADPDHDVTADGVVKNCQVALEFAQKGSEVFCVCSEKSRTSPALFKACIDMLPVHLQLVRNTLVVYYTLARRKFDAGELGTSLAYICLAMQNQEYLEHLVDKQVQCVRNDSSDSGEHGMLAGAGDERHHVEEFLPRLLILAADLQLLQINFTGAERDALRRHFRSAIRDDGDDAGRCHGNLTRLFADVGEKYEWVTRIHDESRQTLAVCRRSYELARTKLDIGSGAHRSAGSRGDGCRGKKWKSADVGGGGDGVGVARKLGHVANEQSSLELDRALKLLAIGAKEGEDEDKKLEEEEKKTWKSSFSHLQAAQQAFAAVHDSTNQALVLSNMGRLMRICAQSTAQRNKGVMSTDEQHLYDNAVDYYQKAISMVQNSKERKMEPTTSSQPHVSVLDNISWELGSAYFNLAQRLQDNAPVSSQRSKSDIERQISDLMSKSLKISSQIWKKTEVSKRPMADQRCAQIHYRLASLHHNSYLQEDDANRRRQLRNMADNHYTRSAHLYQSLAPHHDPAHQLRARLEGLALLEAHLNQSSSSNTSKLKMITEGFERITSCVSALDAMMTSLESCSSATEESSSVDPSPLAADDVPPPPEDLSEWESLLRISSQIVRSLFLSSLKITSPASEISANPNSVKKKASTQLHQKYKDGYSRTLRVLHQGGSTGDGRCDVTRVLSRVRAMREALDETRAFAATKKK